MQRVVDFAGWLEDYWLANGQLPSRAEMIAWIGADGTRAAAIATFYAHMERLTGKQLSDYEGKPGYTFIKSPDGNQTLVVDEDGHVVAARVDGANGASTFETADYAAPAIQAALLALGLTLAPSLTAVIGSGAVGLAFVLGEVFTPYIPDDWSNLTYPVGEARPSQGLPRGHALGDRIIADKWKRHTLRECLVSWNPGEGRHRWRSWQRRNLRRRR